MAGAFSFWRPDIILSELRILTNFAVDLECNVMKGKIWISVVRVLLILLAMMLAGGFVVLRSKTIVDSWIVVTVSVVAAFPVSCILARKDKALVSFGNLFLRIAVWFVFTSTFFSGAFYIVNFVGADKEESFDTSAVVEHKYYEIRHRTRRVGRRYVATGETYKVYYADLRLDNGYLATIPLTGRQISEVRQGQHMGVSVAPGCLGFPVVLTKKTQ